jgi:hypothetical protein
VVEVLSHTELCSFIGMFYLDMVVEVYEETHDHAPQAYQDDV